MHPRATESAAAWASRAQELTGWARDTLINRTDAWIAYLPPRKWQDDVYHTTFRGELGDDQLWRHFQSKNVWDVVGVHATSAAGDARWGTIEVAADHDSDSRPGDRFHAIASWAERLQSRQCASLLEETSSAGDYRLWIFLDRPAPACELAAALASLVNDFADLQLNQPPRVCPTSHADVVDAGDWRRLPGWRPVTPDHAGGDHMSRIWNGQTWIAGDDAIDAIITSAKASADAVLALAATEQRDDADTGNDQPLGAVIDGTVELDDDDFWDVEVEAVLEDDVVDERQHVNSPSSHASHEPRLASTGAVIAGEQGRGHGLDVREQPVDVDVRCRLMAEGLAGEVAERIAGEMTIDAGVIFNHQAPASLELTDTHDTHDTHDTDEADEADDAGSHDAIDPVRHAIAAHIELESVDLDMHVATDLNSKAEPKAAIQTKTESTPDARTKVNAIGIDSRLDVSPALLSSFIKQRDGTACCSPNLPTLQSTSSSGSAAAGKLAPVANRAGVGVDEALGRLVDWFIGQDELLQAIILDQAPADLHAPMLRLMIELAERRKSA